MNFFNSSFLSSLSSFILSTRLYNMKNRNTFFIIFKHIFLIYFSVERFVFTKHFRKYSDEDVQFFYSSLPSSYILLSFVCKWILDAEPSFRKQKSFLLFFPLLLLLLPYIHNEHAEQEKRVLASWRKYNNQKISICNKKLSEHHQKLYV